MIPLQGSSYSSHADFIRNNPKEDITKIQAHIRGWKIRNEVFLPHQILPFVTEHFRIYRLLVNNDDLDIARLICSEVNKMSINPDKYNGKRIQLLATYDTKLKNLIRSFNLFIEMDDADKNIVLLIEPDAREKSLQSELGRGSFKRIYKAQEIKIPRELILDQRTAKCSLNVLAVPKEEKGEWGISIIQRGMRMHKEIFENVEGKFLEPYITLKPSPEHPDELYYKQAWCNSDFYHPSVNGNYPLNFFPNSELIPFTLKDLFKVFSDVAKSLKAMHEQGYVHRDIRPRNLFIKWNGGPEGYIGDFDIAQKIGVAEIKSDDFETNIFGDSLSTCGELIFPSTDIFGLVSALCQCLLPTLSFVRQPRHKDHVKRAATIHFYKRLAGINIPEFKELQKLFSFKQESGNIIPFHSTEILKNILHTHISDEHKDLLNQLEKELTVIDDAFKFAQNLHFRLNCINSEMDNIQEEVKTLKNPEEWLNYFNTKIVPKLYDPAEVYEKFEKLAALLQ